MKTSRLLAFVAVAGIAGVLFLGSTCGLLNKPPSVPEISGPATGIVGVPVTFTATAADPEGDSIAFQFAWGDGDTSDWSALFASGETTAMSHPYADTGSYSVAARAKDWQGAEGAWSSTAAVTIGTASRNYPDSVIGEIPTQPEAYKGAITPDGQYLYVTHHGEGFISCIRLSDRSVLDTVHVGESVREIAISPDGEHAYVTCPIESTVDVVRLSDNVRISSVHTGMNLQGVAVTPDGRSVYVACSATRSVYVIDAASNTVTDSLSCAGLPEYIAFDPTGAFAYVSTADPHEVLVVRVAGLSVVTEIPMRYWPSMMCMHPDGSQLFVSAQGDTGFTVVSTASNTVVGRVKVSAIGYRDMAVMPDGQHILLTDSYGIRYVDIQLGAMVDSLHYPGGSGGLVPHPNADTVYVPANRRVYIVGKR